VSLVLGLCELLAAKVIEARPLRIPYALFKFESGSYQFVGANEVEKSSDDTVELLHKTILVNIKCIQPQDEEVRWNIVAYEVR